MFYGKSDDNDVFAGDTLKATSPTNALAKHAHTPSLRFSESVRPPTALTQASAVLDDVEMLPAPVSNGSGNPARNQRRKRRTMGFGSLRAKVRQDWEQLQESWRRFGATTHGLPIEEQEEVPSTLVSAQSRRDTEDEVDTMVEVDEVIVDSLTQGPASHTNNNQSDSASEAVRDSLDENDRPVEHDTPRRHPQLLFAPYYLFRRTIWAGLRRFYATSFAEPHLEKHYRQETWQVSKPSAAISALFLVINWVLCLVYFPRPFNLADNIFLYGFSPIFNLSPGLTILSNIPVRRPLLYQCMVGIAVWSWSLYQIFYLSACGYYTRDYYLWKEGCGTRDFLGLFYWACALPTIGLFGLGMTRMTNTIGTVIFTIVASVLIIPHRHTWIRNVLNFVAFNLFLLYTHYVREQSERRLYILQDRLIMQNKQTLQAQKNERAAADSKRRLTSYVFHEVRVPLNTAVLAAQNVHASLGAAAQTYKVEFTALSGSLNQMSAVLNDILDFNRMESGKFAFVAQPFAFHTTMRSLFSPLRLSAEARNLRFVTNLDADIDNAALKTTLETIHGVSTEVGVFVGDEQRLRQVVTNLASNACKFTPSGGEVRITTQLLDSTYHVPHKSQLQTMSITASQARGSEEASRHTQPETITVRIEIADTGVGIHRRDMIESKLFSSFSQTEQGRLQGGKGTGLGLAIVRQIVQLSGGRLRVQSRVGLGTTFSVDLPLRLMPLETRSGTPALLRSNSNPLSRPPLLSTYPSPPTSQGSGSSIVVGGGAVSTPGTFARAKMLADPMLSPLSHAYPNSQLMSLARGQPVQPLQTPEEEAVTAHASSGLHFLSRPPSSHDATAELARPVSPPPISISPPPVAHSVSTPGPRRRGSTSGYGETDAPPSPSFSEGLHVLVVDDDNMTRMLMKRMLSRLGCVVDVAENGQTAMNMICAPPEGEQDLAASTSIPMAKLGATVGTSTTMDSTTTSPLPTPGSESGSGSYGSQRKSSYGLRPGLPHGTLRYAVVFLDNQMPIMSGLDAVRTLRARGAEVFVVGVTGNALLTDTQEFTEAGANHVLTKPVFERDLKRMLALADERRRRSVAASEPPTSS